MKNKKMCEGQAEPVDQLGPNEEDFLSKTRRILISGEIDDDLANSVNTKLQYFSMNQKPVYIYISSPGGDMNAGYSIVDQIELSSFPVCTIIRGQASSMAATIAAYGNIGNRYITKNSSIMIHPMIIQPNSCDIEEHVIAMGHLQQYYKDTIKDLKARLRLNKDDSLENILSKTKWMNAKEAIKFGIVDHIWTRQMESLVGK